MSLWVKLSVAEQSGCFYTKASPLRTEIILIRLFVYAFLSELSWEIQYSFYALSFPTQFDIDPFSVLNLGHMSNYAGEMHRNYKSPMSSV